MLEVRNLNTYFYQDQGVIKAVDDVSFSVRKGETLGLLGESGSGKSTVAQSIMRLVPPPGKVAYGFVELDGTDLLRLAEKEMIKVRGGRISMIFQDPFSSLDPVFTAGDQIIEAIRLHQRLSRKEARSKAEEMLVKVRIDPGRMGDYPHQFSGGMRQRVMIAMALSCRPDYLLCDEPTTALDADIQDEMLRLIKDLQREFGFGMLFITHNFNVAKNVCDSYAVMRKGKIVESGKDVFSDPKHEYTKELVGCMRALYG